jgi:hypothetical protein
MKKLIFGGLIVLLSSCGGGATSNEVPASDNTKSATEVVDSMGTNNVDTVKTK